MEVTEPPQKQLKELQDIDESKQHPRVFTKDEDNEYLTPEMDEQRRRESVQLDEDGEEFKAIQQEREDRLKIEQLRNQNNEDILSNDIENDDIENDEEYELNLDDMNVLPDFSGISRLKTDPVNEKDALKNKSNEKMEEVKMVKNKVGNDNLKGIDENEEYDEAELIMDDLSTLPNMSGMTRLKTDPVNEQQKADEAKSMKQMQTVKESVDDEAELIMDDLSTLPNMSGLSRLQTDPVNEPEKPLTTGNDTKQ